LPGGPFLHEVGGEHPRPEDDAVILEAPCGRRPDRSEKGWPPWPLLCNHGQALPIPCISGQKSDRAETLGPFFLSAPTPPTGHQERLGVAPKESQFLHPAAG
jgi:hypothetical protein